MIRNTRIPSGLGGFEAAVALLNHISESGNKWPQIFLSLKADKDDPDDRRIKLYRYQHGQNMGSAGMKLGDDWLGNIDRRTGYWSPTAAARRLDADSKAKVWAVLKLLKDNPHELFARNGKLVGTCAACGRPLSNDESVEIGIGPECRSKMGGLI